MLTTIGITGARAKHAGATDDTLTIELADGRTISAPLAWFPRLLHATPKERATWRLVGGGRAVRWPELDEDISVASLLLGQPSSESPTSFQKWLEMRAKYRSAKQRLNK
jgi:Protein of unknown function (DUF2442)